MQITLRRLGPIEVLRLGRKIVRDFHRYELAGYHYAERSIFAGGRWRWKSPPPAGPAATWSTSSPIRRPAPGGLPRHRAPGAGATASARRCSGSSVRTTLTPPSTLKWKDPAAAKSRAEAELMLRRIGFYDRCGFSLLSFRLTAGPWQLLVMTDTPRGGASDPPPVRRLLGKTHRPCLGRPILS